jgi:hypothetical protein
VTFPRLRGGCIDVDYKYRYRKRPLGSPTIGPAPIRGNFAGMISFCQDEAIHARADRPAARHMIDWGKDLDAA